MIPSPPSEERLPGLSPELENIRPALEALTKDRYGFAPLAATLLGLVEACQKADQEAARQESIFELADAPLTVSELYRARGHLAAASREILAACHLVLPRPGLQPGKMPGE